MQCIICDDSLHECAPTIEINERLVCSVCAINLIEPIYRLGGTGDIQKLIFKDCIAMRHNRRKPLPRSSRYRKHLSELLEKHAFKCAHCERDYNLTIDHIKPVSKGGDDSIENLQILCKPCNSRKGAR